MLVEGMDFVKTESNGTFPRSYLNLSTRTEMSSGTTKQRMHFKKCECHLDHFKESRCEISKVLQEWFLTQQMCAHAC